MTAFRYRALNGAGEVVEGRMEAASREAVNARLEDQGQMLIRAEEVADDGPMSGPMSALMNVGGSRQPAAAAPARKPFWRRGISEDQLGTLTQEMARLVAAGIPLERVFEIMIGVAENPHVGRVLQRILEGLRAGRSLAAVLEECGPPFSRMYVNLIHAGEVGGSLDVVLTRLAEHMARARQLRASIVSALIYPIILLTVAVGALMLLLVFVVPQFETLFADAGATLPAATQTVIAAARLAEEYWWTPLAAFLAAALLGPPLYAMPWFRRLWDALMLRLPLLGSVVRKLEVARFSRVLSVLLVNGVPLLSALQVVKESVGNSRLAAALERAMTRLKAGEGLARPLAEQGAFPPLAVHMIRVGEETGRLDVMLLDVAQVFDDDVAESLKKMLALLEPVLILTLGVMMGGIIVSILLAILSVNDLAF